MRASSSITQVSPAAPASVRTESAPGRAASGSAAQRDAPTRTAAAAYSGWSSSVSSATSTRASSSTARWPMARVASPRRVAPNASDASSPARRRCSWFSSVGGTYQTGTTSTWVANDNVNLTTGTSTVASNLTINSLSLKQTAQAILDLGGNTLTISSGGILRTGKFISTIQYGTLKAGSGNEFYLWNTGANNQIVNASIADNGSATSLTKAGANTTVLAATNSYTGQTTVEGGTLQIGNGGTTGDLGNTSGLVLNGGANLTFNHSNSFSYSGNIIASTGSPAPFDTQLLPQ